MSLLIERRSSLVFSKRQSGVSLVVVLILLIAISVLGIAVLRLSLIHI